VNYLRLLSNFRIATDALLANKVRSALTALGIIFGVAAVIAMLAIGNGAQQEILDQIKLVGVNNVVIKPIVEQEEGKVDEKAGGADASQKPKRYSRGLDLEDARSILELIPTVEQVSPEVVFETDIIRSGLRRSSRIVGVEPAYFEIANLPLDEGSHFTAEQLAKGQGVCIIGAGIRKKFFTNEVALGNYIKVGSHWLKVVGILSETLVSEKAIENLGIRDFNMDVYAPIKTVLGRYINRSSVLVPKQEDESFFIDGVEVGGGDKDKGPINYHQLDRLVVQVEAPEAVAPTTEVILRMLTRRHNEVVDFEVTIPEQLLKQQQRTKDIFNMVLGAIAGISLLVGGIGIMNIMLASVLERTREIGTRRALGATRKDVVSQFMFEAMLISLSGGMVGVILGVSMAYFIEGITDIKTIVSPLSIVLSFGVSAAIGLIFGITPAKKAASQNPIESLRYE
jgi:putative ABC transport system permease protein